MSKVRGIRRPEVFGIKNRKAQTAEPKITKANICGYRNRRAEVYRSGKRKAKGEKLKPADLGSRDSEVRGTGDSDVLGITAFGIAAAAEKFAVASLAP